MKPDEQDQTPIHKAFGYCAWCKGYASDVRPVQASDQGSGPQQASASACPTHRERHNLVPLADQP